MNFDFNATEQALFKELREQLGSFAEGRSLESSDVVLAEQNARDALALLGGTPYLKLGLADGNGQPNGSLALMAAMETLAEVSQSLFLTVEVSTRIFGRALSAWGSDEQKKKWLDPLVDGKLLGALALSEDAMNVDNDPLVTEGRQEAGDIVINGAKQYVINAPLADWIAVVGRMGNESAIFMVKQGTPGLTVSSRLNTMGYDGAVIAGLTLSDCRIPANQVIGPFTGDTMLKSLRLWENQVLLAATLGMMKGSYESARVWAKAHKSGGKPIIAYQEVGFKLSEMLTLYQTAQLLAYRSAWTVDNTPREAESLTWCAKVFCTESAETVSSSALQILAGKGYISGNTAEQAFRCAKYSQIAGTSTELCRVKIGDNALGYK
mgnify:CR=1 FL=1